MAEKTKLANEVAKIKEAYGKPIDRASLQVIGMQLALYQIQLLEEIRDLLKPTEPAAKVGKESPLPVTPRPETISTTERAFKAKPLKELIKPKAKRKAKKK